jgi:uncharacterized protein
MNDIQQKIVTALLDPRRYPHAAKSVRLIETHISWVLLAGRYAYKIKKALDLEFLDYSTLEKRCFCCAEEVRLNRRLAPKIYLDAISIGGSAEQPEFGAEPAIEYAVRMRRFSTTNLMDRLLTRGRVTPQHIDELAAVIAHFHAGLPAAQEGSAYGSAASIQEESLQNFEQLHELLHSPGDWKAAAALGTATATEYSACAETFKVRRAQGYVRECHGDLHLGNIALIGGKPVPFDGIEFNPALRWLDVMDEAAFPVMDLLHRGHPELAWRFLNSYLEITGDYAGVAVLRFYLADRATVRAKVGAIRAIQADATPSTAANELENCRSYLALAADFLARRKPALIITHGLPGSGKSTFAQTALQHYGAIRIRSDVERKRLFGLGALEHSRSGIGSGIYGEEATQRTYARLLELARGLLATGFPVIVDAAFLKQEERASFHLLAQEMDAPFAIASTHAELASLRTRIMHRHEQAHDASEADLAVLDKLRAAQEPLVPGEPDRTVEFGEGTCRDTSAACWSKLEELLG